MNEVTASTPELRELFESVVAVHGEAAFNAAIQDTATGAFSVNESQEKMNEFMDRALVGYLFTNGLLKS